MVYHQSFPVRRVVLCQMTRKLSSLPLRLRIVEFLIRLLLPLVGVGLLAAGLVGVVSFALLPLAEAFTTRNWVAVEARVEDMRRESLGMVVPLPIDRVVLRYSYTRDGQRFESSHFGPQRGLNTRRRSAEFLARVGSDPRLTVWVDANSPDRATVQRRLNWVLVALALPALAFGFLGAMMVLASMMLWNDRRSLFRRRNSRRFKQSD